MGPFGWRAVACGPQVHRPLDRGPRARQPGAHRAPRGAALRRRLAKGRSLQLLCGTAAMSAFDESYFRTHTYARVSFARFSQYWWSNRFYAILARRYGRRGGTLLEVGC